MSVEHGNGSARVEVIAHQEAKHGNYCCGDSYFYKETDKEFVCALADGLGSGPYALESSQAVVNVIEQHMHQSIDFIITKCNEVLLNKRGAVLGILRMNFHSERFSFTSIGNIGIVMITPNGERKRNIPVGGFLSGVPRLYKVLEDKLIPGSSFFMFTDGVNDRTLSAKTFASHRLDFIVESFVKQKAIRNQDDTTFIAMKYK
ncbi:SpoIIE family protein phosphatase [Pontibacillus litoralis]|uniref:Indirect negative regulator of sigma-B activity n=1 Tax=Pontibacillus litoralis JSM 072002 TaxID=1385512 RepID=A0A0A5HSH3_9BACI|nr:SpoIIE family protein phosphatase [Pontibacillus litoralis]KGX86557.1 indirect negative regulator of sigma-B activity [Pontibacillus litoralis JSM 072002]